MSKVGKDAVRADGQVVAASEVKRPEERVRDLEGMLARKDHGGQDPNGGS
ncbi:hypothetical protein NLM33_18690 [Bradyrhizobium sp. CCGUVB1N3]|nr:hypothetical protein [Bradyrhizobium sp. CCGUVB1N3]MCP3472346.1 hypothetical protein [Bradyrhizobium sp. CCGUVB1N3]